MGLVTVRFPQSVGEPLETFVETVTGGSAGGLDELEKITLVNGGRDGGDESNLPKHGG